MGANPVSEEEFISIWHQTGGSAKAVSKALGINERAAHKRRRDIEMRRGERLLSFSPKSPDAPIVATTNTFIRRNKTIIENGQVAVFTDAHIYPGVVTTARRSLLKFLESERVKAVVDNGDSFDGGQISRHGRIHYDDRPTVKQELEEVQRFHEEIEARANGAALWWNWGNHDSRWPIRLAEQAAEFEGIRGFHFETYFPRWTFGVSLTINPEAHTPTLIKHRYRGGDHADWNNVMRAGINIGTGHDHQLTVRAFNDKRGIRYGFRCGTLSDAGLPIFDYQEDNPSQQISGWMLLTFHKGRLLRPEPITVVGDGEVEFRGKVYEV